MLQGNKIVMNLTKQINLFTNFFPCFERLFRVKPMFESVSFKYILFQGDTRQILSSQILSNDTLFSDYLILIAAKCKDMSYFANTTYSFLHKNVDLDSLGIMWVGSI